MKMNRWIAAAAALILALGCIGTVFAEIIPPQEPGQQIGYPAVVLCEELTLREEPSSSAKAAATLVYGDMPIVVGADREDGPEVKNGFVYCTLGDGEDSPVGWINADYLAINPAWYVTEKETAVYAWNDTAALKVALLDKDVRLPILKEEEDWYIVSLRGAVGFILK